MTDWSQIVKRHGPLVWKTVYRLLDDDADAADCFQNAFVSALEVSRRESVRNWPALLRHLATARALERLRVRARESGRLTGLAGDGPPDAPANDPARAAQAAELAADLREALAELEPRQAQVFCLACLEGFSYREVAGQLGVTSNHVGVLLSRARAGLQKRLEAHRPEAFPRRSDREAP